jgi:hypothetical protein
MLVTLGRQLRSGLNNFSQATSMVYYYLIKLQMGFTRWQWYYNKIQDTKIHISHKITHHVQIKHSTQSSEDNKGHITHKEYNVKKKK